MSRHDLLKVLGIDVEKTKMHEVEAIFGRHFAKPVEVERTENSLSVTYDCDGHFYDFYFECNSYEILIKYYINTYKFDEKGLFDKRTECWETA